MKQFREVLCYICGYLRRHLLRFYFHRHIHHGGMKDKFGDYEHIHRFRFFNEDVPDNFIKLSCANPGEYELFTACCDRKFRYRLLEMGFVPGGDLTVINSNLNGGVMIKIKGAKIALSNDVADKILVREKK
ncbi:MAG: ferrous iron transport protein A [Endomicrobium sp.]|nr:ferrous iron transport protein A [Endomicrobium sp.]